MLDVKKVGGGGKKVAWWGTIPFDACVTPVKQI